MIPDWADIVGTIGLIVSIGALAWQVRRYLDAQAREKIAEIQSSLNAVRASAKRLRDIIDGRLYLFAEMDAAAAKSIIDVVPGLSSRQELFETLRDESTHNAFVGNMSKSVHETPLRKLVEEEFPLISQAIFDVEFRMPVTMQIISRCVEVLSSVCREMLSTPAYLNITETRLPARFDAEAFINQIEDQRTVEKQEHEAESIAKLSSDLLNVIQQNRIEKFSAVYQPLFNCTANLIDEVIISVLNLSETNLKKLVADDRTLLSKVSLEYDPFFQVTANIEKLNPTLSALDPKRAYEIRAALRQLIETYTALYPEADRAEMHKRFKILEES